MRTSGAGEHMKRRVKRPSACSTGRAWARLLRCAAFAFRLPAEVHRRPMKRRDRRNSQKFGCPWGRAGKREITLSHRDVRSITVTYGRISLTEL
jgi:hypothetical protein